MVTPVALGQVRFTLPGLVPDARGVVSGRELVARFPTLDRLIWFLRLLSADAGRDELWSGLRILYARSTLGLREVVVMLPSPATHTADVVARAARTAGGQCFTGSGKHFVVYRDARAPLGYDAREMSHEPADLTLYAPEQTAGYRFEGEMPLARLLYGLEPRRLAGAVETVFRAGEGTLGYVTARRGLGPRLVDYLFRAGIRADAAICEPERTTAFGLSSSVWLFRVPDVPARLLGLLARTPGLSLYVPVLENVLVAAGYAHPIHLEACRAIFPRDHLVLFAPAPVGVTALAGPPPFVPVGDLVQTRVPGAAAPAVATARASAPPVFDIALRLEPSAEPRVRAVGAWIPWSQAGWLRRVCYALPATALRGYRVALLEPAVFVLAADELSGIPFGQPLRRVANGVLVPVGTELRPALSSELMAERFGIGEGSFLVFPGGGARPVRISAGDLEPLERRILAQLRLDQDRPAMARRSVPPLEDARGPDVENEPLGPWPLWGLDR